MNHAFHHLRRRDFVKYSLLMAAAASMPSMQGCAIPKKNVPSFDDKAFLIKNANLVDVNSGQIVKDAWLIVDKGNIAAQGTGDAPPGRHRLVFDMKGRYLIPGLIDAHCHSTVTSVFSMRMTNIMHHARQQKQNYVSSIESGVTTLRDMGAFPGLLHMFIRDIEEGSMPGPRVLYCNSILNLMGGHPEIPPSDMNIFAKPLSLFIGMVMDNFEDIAEMEQDLEENAKGASLIKLTMDNQTIFCKKKKEIPVYTSDQLNIIFRFADKKGLPVSAHHQFKYGFDRVMEFPFHSIEHMPSDAVLSDEDILKMAKRNVAIVPTMTVGQSYLMEEAFDELPPQYRTPEVTKELEVRRDYFKNEAWKHCDPLLHRQNLAALNDYKKYGIDNLWEKKKFLVNPYVFFNMIANGFANLKKMNQAGILIGCGIDAGMPFNYFGGNYREYEIMNRAGFTNIEILRCATINNAKIIRLEDKTGSLETGKYADMVALNDNPLDDIRALRKPQMVFKQGELMFSAGNLREEGIIPT
ncbi:MAG TPA: amidohydrolase family protein [Smithella sp.]|nr:amidohydrolase family protein [Smithella sp.]